MKIALKHPDYNYEPRTKEEWFKLAERWIRQCNKLMAYIRDESKPEEKRKKAQELHVQREARVIMIFASIIRHVMDEAAKRKTSIITEVGGIDEAMKDQKRMRNLIASRRGTHFNRRFKKR